MTPPNIIWIYCDELRTDALGCYGHPHADIRTPHIDSLAETGIRFAHTFCNSPVCVASRTSVLTALYPEQTGVFHNEAVWPNYRFPDPPRTFPRLFADAGYATANFGKVHVPASLDVWQQSDPTGGGMRAFYDLATPEELQPIRPPGIPTVIGGVFPDDRPFPAAAVTDNALAWLARTDGPFFARLSILQPHTPVFPPARLAQLYADAAFPTDVPDVDGLSRFERRFGEVSQGYRLPRADRLRAKAAYYALVGWIDEEVGRLLAGLRQQGLLERTIVVFDADHGCSLGEGRRYQKQTFAPESQRVPRLISWPGTLPGGQVRTDLNESLDLARTLCALADIQPDNAFRGRDLLADDPPDAVFSTIGYGFPSSRAFPNLGKGSFGDGHGWPRRACIRTGQFRLDKNVRINGAPPPPDAADVFLADWQADPAEATNLAADPAYAETVRTLSARLDAHCAESVEVPEAWTLRA